MTESAGRFRLEVRHVQVRRVLAGGLRRRYGLHPGVHRGSPHYARGEHVGRLRGMVYFVGAPVGDGEWVMEELRIIFGKLW